jgi:hypothetical protein
MRKAKLCKRLGGKGHGGLMEKVPTKPKGMHWSTYRELSFRIREENAFMVSGLAAMLERWGCVKRW